MEIKAPHASREDRIKDLLAWAEQMKLFRGLKDLDEFDQSSKRQEIYQKLKLRAMSEFYLSSRLAAEYAAVVMEKLGANGTESSK